MSPLVCILDLWSIVPVSSFFKSSECQILGRIFDMNFFLGTWCFSGGTNMNKGSIPPFYQSAFHTQTFPLDQDWHYLEVQFTE